MSNQLLYNSEAQICGLYPIHGIGDAENPPEWVEAFVDSHAFEKLARDFPELGGLLEADQLSTSEMATELAERWAIVGRTGFIVQAHVNVRAYQKGGSFFSGPGHQQIHWFYVFTAENAVPELIKRAEEQHARSKAQAGAK